MTLIECFKNSLYENRDWDNEFPVIYEQLMIKLLSPKESESKLQYLFEEYCDEDKDWFVCFHKSIRQSDFYGYDTEYSITYINSLITEEEILERKKLLEFKHKKRLEVGREYITELFDKEYPDYGYRIGELNRKFSNTEKKSIAGNLDVILHAMISSDGGFLKNKLLNCFEDYKHYKSKQEKGLK